MTDIKLLQEQYGLTKEEAIKAFREGELLRINCEQEGDNINVTFSYLFRSIDDDL